MVGAVLGFVQECMVAVRVPPSFGVGVIVRAFVDIADRIVAGMRFVRG